jgi:hypothetical protein
VTALGLTSDGVGSLDLSVSHWLAFSARLCPGHQERAVDVDRDWRAWARENKRDVGPHDHVLEQLMLRGHPCRRDAAGVRWCEGLRLLRVLS